MARKEIIVRYFCLWSAMLVSVLASAQETDVWNTTYKQIEQSIRKPMFANQTYNFKDFGARIDATAAENQKAINEAIASCSNEGGGRLIVPEGVWNTGGIVLQTGVNLVLEKGATLLFSADTNL
ncbi:MAG: glycoside hydrolase, partial [Bacteroidaceae bacterium]|nr:glycoside hydrolase [Bacteroidaceae bacterium]